MRKCPFARTKSALENVLFYLFQSSAFSETEITTAGQRRVWGARGGDGVKDQRPLISAQKPSSFTIIFNLSNCIISSPQYFLSFSIFPLFTVFIVHPTLRRVVPFWIQSISNVLSILKSALQNVFSVFCIQRNGNHDRGQRRVWGARGGDGVKDQRLLISAQKPCSFRSPFLQRPPPRL